jgi:hypothetical protein
MKTTIKIDAGRSLVVQPNKTGPGLRFSVEVFGHTMASVVMTPDQCGALITGIQIANEVIEAKEGAGLRCHGDACCGGQLPCPTPGACGVTA